MFKAITNTSPLLYLYRIGAIHWLPQLFEEIRVPDAVMIELNEGRQRGYDVPMVKNYSWLTITNPQFTPSAWFALDLGAGELAAMSLALENPLYVILLDDALARKTAQAAGLTVWGTLKVLLEAKRVGLIPEIAPSVDQLNKAGMWLSAEMRQRVLALANE
jgi:predicted nucleic acid-binding protein